MDSNRIFKEVKISHVFLIYIISNIITLTVDVVIEMNFEFISLCIDIFMLGMLLYMYKASYKNIKVLYKDFLSKVNIKEILSVVVTQICFSMGSALILINLVYVFIPDVLSELLDSTSYETFSYSSLIISFLLIVILAPIVEELVFRGIIFKRLCIKRSILLSMVLSSVFFGILHLELAIVGAIAFGIANCILYIKYKNILIPMLVHFINNLIAFIPQFFTGEVDGSIEYVATSTDIIITSIFGAILLTIGTFIFIKFIIKNKRYLYKSNRQTI